MVTQAVLAVGGRGERLRPFTDQIPKPLLRIDGKTILERLIQALPASVKKVTLLAGYRSEDFLIYSEGASLGREIEVYVESEPLGTVGALSMLDIQEPILFLNGDISLDCSLDKMCLFHRDSSAHLTVGTTVYSHSIPYGVVLSNDKGIKRVDEKPIVEWSVAAGVYVIGPDAFRVLVSHEKRDMPDLVNQCVLNGYTVVEYKLPGRWSDIGTPADLERELLWRATR